MGRLLLIIGVVIFIIGIAFILLGRIPGIGRLPGDITISRGGFTLFFPIVTMLLVSVVLTIVLNVIARFFR